MDTLVPFRMLMEWSTWQPRVYLRGKNGTIAARDAITLTLLGMLEDDSPSHVFNAYNTLRLIMSVSTAQDLKAQMNSDHYCVELDYLRVYWCSPNSRPTWNLAHELKSDLGFDNFSRWI